MVLEKTVGPASTTCTSMYDQQGAGNTHLHVWTVGALWFVALRTDLDTTGMRPAGVLLVIIMTAANAAPLQVTRLRRRAAGSTFVKTAWDSKRAHRDWCSDVAGD